MRIEGFVEFESENQIRGWAANAEQLDQVLQVEVICRGETGCMVSHLRSVGI